MTPNMTTSDIGLAIRDFIEEQTFSRQCGDIDDNSDEQAEIVFVDCSDTDNLHIHLDNGQRFAIRIMAL